MLGVETIEAPNRGDALRFLTSEDWHADRVGQLLDGVKYLATAWKDAWLRVVDFCRLYWFAVTGY